MEKQQLSETNKLKEDIKETSGEAIASVLSPYCGNDNPLIIEARPKGAELTLEAWKKKVEFTIRYYSTPTLSQRNAKEETGTSASRNGVIANKTVEQLRDYLVKKGGYENLRELDLKESKKKYRNNKK